MNLLNPREPDWQRKVVERGAWLVQLVKHVTFDLPVVSSSPMLGVKIILKIFLNFFN